MMSSMRQQSATLSPPKYQEALAVGKDYPGRDDPG